MAIKLEDVAKLAGVSPTTVSRVINHYGYLSQKTIDKVHAAMRELNYQPNTSARSLQGKSAKMIGLIFPSVSKPFYAELIETLERQLFSKGYKVLLCDCEQNPEKEREYLSMLAANQVDGIITSSHNLGISEYQNVRLPIVSFDRFLAPGIPIVASDNYQGAKLATETLIKQGAKKIAIITGHNDTDSPTYLRLRAYLETLDSNGYEPHITSFTKETTETFKNSQITKLLTDTEIDGIFCTDDLTAISVINLAHKLGLKLPDQLKVIGYDGTRLIRHYFPMLSTVVQPMLEMADVLIELLMKRIETPDIQLDERYILPIKLEISETY